MDTDRVTGAAREVAGNVESAAGRFVGDAGTEVRGLADQAAGIAQKTYGRAKDAVRDVAGQAPDYATAAYDKGVDAYRDSSELVARRVQESPMGSLLVAAAAGYALAWIVHGRR